MKMKNQLTILFMVYMVGIDQYGDVNNHHDILEQAYEMGKNIENRGNP